MPQIGKLPVLNLLRPKINFFRPAGATRCTDSGQIWYGRRAPGSAWLCNILSQSAQGVGMRPQNIKLFGKELPRRGESLDRFLIFRVFFTPHYATLVFQSWCDSLHRLRSYCWETARRQIRPNISVHPVGKTMRWIKKWIPPFMMGTTSCITV